MDATFTLAGEIASFDAPAFRSSLLALFPEAESAGVDASAASIRVEARLTLRSAPAADRAVQRLGQASPEDLSSQLGVIVEAISAPVLMQLSSSASDSSGPGALVEEELQTLGLSSGSQTAKGETAATVAVWRTVALGALAALAAALLLSYTRWRRRLFVARGGPAGPRTDQSPSSTATATPSEVVHVCAVVAATPVAREVDGEDHGSQEDGDSGRCSPQLSTAKQIPEGIPVDPNFDPFPVGSPRGSSLSWLVGLELEQSCSATEPDVKENTHLRV